MDVEQELKVVQAEAIALQAVLMGVLKRLLAARPELSGALCQAFDDAETLMTGIAVRHGADPSAVAAMEVIEQIRRAVITDESICRN